MVLSKYLSFVKIEHSVFSFFIVFSGFFLSHVIHPIITIDVMSVILIFCATVTARSAGFGFNRLIDYKIDALNPRTLKRHIPSGIISLRESKIFIGINIFLFLFFCFLIHPICLYLSFIPIILFWIYPYLKRFTCLCHFGLGGSWGLAPLGGWIAGVLSVSSLSLSLISASIVYLVLFSILWITGFDIIYALLDEEFDRQHHIRSIPAFFGHKKSILLSLVLHILSIVCLSILFFSFLSAYALIFLIGIVGCFIYIYINLYRLKKLDKFVQNVFVPINAIISILVFLMTVSEYIFIS